MYNNIMRKKTSSIISIISLVCIAAYVSALIYGSYLMYGNITERRTIAEQEFTDLARRSSEAGVLGFMDADFQYAIEDTITHSRTIRGVIVSGPDGEYAFPRSQDSGIINWVDDSPRFSSRFGTSSKPFFSPLRIEGLRNVTISAAYSYIDDDYFIAVLKQTLLIILAALSVAFLSLILEVALGKKTTDDEDIPVIRDDEFYTPPPTPATARPAVEPQFVPPYPAPYPGNPSYPPLPPFTAKYSGTAVKEAPVPVTPVKPQKTPAIEPEQSQDEMTDAEAQLQEPEALTEDLNRLQEASGSTDVQLREPDLPDPAPQEVPGEPDTSGSLYSPRGISREDYTMERLEAELNRCASSDQDLTIMVMEYREDGADEAACARLVDAAVSCFNLRDLIFEKGNQGISVIIPNTDLEQGLARAEEFQSLLQSPDPAGSDAAALPPVSIGLSSRSGRLVNADRLLFEASQAMQKARQEPASPIIAFKSDPEKYRDFIQRTQ
ncbi:hypothetical protein AGMMS49991_02670 [Spirochaetia bacterium]|nr:hypothetical protein AGMMS49991_02670 [Spirochaetia bacterium]